MTEEKTICTLDFLIGTMATAYKGTITSLVLKDFCVLEKDSSTVFKGTVLSIPEGMYQASLMHAGIELSRSNLQNGYFELRADIEVARNASQLQIDIVQNGRHIGTFLLKKEKSDDVFISALELSEEIKDINFGTPDSSFVWEDRPVEKSRRDCFRRSVPEAGLARGSPRR